MPVQISAQCYQANPGAAVQARCTQQFPGQTEWDAWSYSGFGVKATSAAPTNVSEFGGHIFDSSAALLDTLDVDSHTHSAPSGTLVGLNNRVTYSKRIALDSNWVVGHYAFAYALGADGAIVAVSKPYRIR